MTSTGTWEPNQDQITPDSDRVRQWAATTWLDANQLTSELDDLDRASLQRWIGLSAERWNDIFSKLGAVELVNLMRLGTLAEQHLPGCEAGERSVVIHAFHWHKQHHGQPDRELVRWIKSHTDNRFLPYGPVL